MDLYESLKNDGIYDITHLGYWNNCFLTLDKAKELEEAESAVNEESLRVLKEGDAEGIYLMDQDGYLDRICRLTEKNASIIEEKMKRTRAGYLAKMFKRINFEA